MKTENIKYRSLRLQPALDQRIKEAAKEERRSVHAQIVRFIEDGLEELERAA